MIPKGFIEIPLFVWSTEEKEAHDEAVAKWRKDKTGPRPAYAPLRTELSCIEVRGVMEIRDSVVDEAEGRPRQTAMSLRAFEHEWGTRRVTVGTPLPYAEVRDMIARARDEAGK